MHFIGKISDHVDDERLWASILDMARIGATANGGSNRIAFSEEDDEGRALFGSWCEEAGLSVSSDPFGNIYAVRKGRLDIAPLMIGSHLDTQPRGGRFDGVLGVLGGLEVVRAMNDAGMETERPVMLVNWTNEEGAVLAPMMGSAVFTGALPLSEALASRLPDGRRVDHALSAMRCGAGDAPFGFPVHAYLELHIEQGPVLEDENLMIGVVTGGIGFQRYAVRFDGQEAHAGPTPMASRKDAMVTAARAIVLADDLGRRHPEARSTVGTISVEEGSPNKVAAGVEFTVDFRHAEAPVLSGMTAEYFDALGTLANEASVSVSHRLIADSPSAPFDLHVMDAVENAAKDLGLACRRMPSGAGHDACNISRSYPTGMVFVPSERGLSHNEAEFTGKTHCAAGAKVLADAAMCFMTIGCRGPRHD